MGKLGHEGNRGLVQSCTVRPQCSQHWIILVQMKVLDGKCGYQATRSIVSPSSHLQTHTHLVFTTVWTLVPLGSGTGTFVPHFSHGVCSLRCWQLKIVCILKFFNDLQAGGCSFINKCLYLEHFSSSFCHSKSPFSLESLCFKVCILKVFLKGG